MHYFRNLCILSSPCPPGRCSGGTSWVGLPRAEPLFLATTAQAQSVYSTPYVVTTFAGLTSYGSTDGVGSAAQFNAPFGVAMDGAGNCYVTDAANSTIRKISPSGVVSTFAGSAGLPGSTDGAGSAARFNYPLGIAADGAGNLYVTDSSNCTVRMITPAGVVSTLAGRAGFSGHADGIGTAATFFIPVGVAVDGSGNLFISDAENNTIRKMVIATRQVTTVAGRAGVTGHTDAVGTAASFSLPLGLVVDPSGNIFVADSDNYTVRMITASGVVTTILGTPGVFGHVDGTGPAAQFGEIQGVALDSAGNLYFSDYSFNAISKATKSGVSWTATEVAGHSDVSGSSNGTGSSALLYSPALMTIDNAGNLYVVESNNNDVREVALSTFAVTTIAGTRGSGSVDGATSAARFDGPRSLAFDRAGNLYVVDEFHDTIRQITPGGTVTTIAGTAGVIGGADGVGAAAQFHDPASIVVDASGNLYVGDQDNSTIREITPSVANGTTLWTVTTIAGSPGVAALVNGTGTLARFNYPVGLALDNAGNLYIADSGNYVVRKLVLATGAVTTLAGGGTLGFLDGVGTAASFSRPQNLVFDGIGNLYVTDTSSYTIRKIVVATGAVTTFAGRATYSGSTDGTGPLALFTNPNGIAADTSGNLYVTDGTGGTLRRIVASTGAVTTLAGFANASGSQDGFGAGVSFRDPYGIVCSATGAFTLPTRITMRFVWPFPESIPPGQHPITPLSPWRRQSWPERRLYSTRLPPVPLHRPINGSSTGPIFLAPRAPGW